MEDRNFNPQDYHVEEDSDGPDYKDVLSSDDEATDMLILSRNGKDILKEKAGGNSKLHEIELGDNVPSENLMYDANIDKDNEEWMRKKRNQYSNAPDDGNKKITSDAMLCCPGCMITVCFDCQRHDLYKNQFRAMFVTNCSVNPNQLLRYEHKNKSKKRRKKEGPGKLVEYKPDNEKESECTEIYNPVNCDECNTEIAVYDKDEVYHFFNVLESLP